MANKIEETEANAAYEFARQVYDGEMSEKDAVNKLYENYGLSNGSASDLVRNFAQMMKGKSYHRTLNHLTTRVYFDRILKDYGENALEIAIAATLAHVKYYEGLEKGGRQPGIRAICDEFQNKVSSIKSAFTERLGDNFQREVEKSLHDNDEARYARLDVAPKTPEKRVSQQIVYVRNPDVVAQSLKLANGICQHCKVPAPFHKPNGEPFLEVHHIIPLSENGLDEVDNAKALCPNCHREAHFGVHSGKFRT